MKKYWAIAMVLAMIVSLIAAPVSAGPTPTPPPIPPPGEVTTGVNVNAAGGNPPLIKAKWEQDFTINLEDGDPLHLTPGSQFLPPLAFEGLRYINYFAIVTDPEGVLDVANVYVDVFHPAGKPECGSFKYELELIPIIKDVGKAWFLDAWDAGLVTWNDQMYATAEEALADIIDEIDECLAEIYWAQGVLHYHQPSGDYLVQIFGVDGNNNWSDPLGNYMTYIGMQAFEVDFTHVDYGSVNVSVPKVVGGDKVFAPGGAFKPTIRNIGNVGLQLMIEQDDMFMGKTGEMFNVSYDANLGVNGTNIGYDPFTQITLPDVLFPCNTEKLDFSIHVWKAPAGSYSGLMWLDCNPFPWAPDCVL